MKLHLIRHPKPAVADGICYGRTDLGIAEDAAVVAARLRPQLPPDAPLYSSPLTRCRLLAAELHPAPRIDARLVEMHFGTWEMQPWKSIERTHLDAWAADPRGFAPPGGESPGQMLARVADFCAELEAAGTPEAVLVIHAGVMKALHGLRRNLPDAEWMKLSFDFGSISIIE